MTRWPALRTARGGHRHLSVGQVILAGLAGLFVAPFLGAAMMALAHPAGLLVGYETDLPLILSGLGLFLIYSPIVAWTGMLLGIPLSIWAIARGWAGWGLALVAGALTGLGMAGLIGSSPALAGFGMIDAGAYWLALRCLCPQAFGVAPK